MNLPPNLGLKQCRYGPMLYLKSDQYIGQALDLYGEFSEGEVHLFRQIVKPDWVVFDVGANHGTHTVALTQMAKTVHAFEPQRVLFQIINANLALNGLTNVDAHNVAVGKTPGSIGVPVVDYTKPSNFGAVELGLGEQVELITLDSMMVGCDFMKVDVEGMEGEVIKGAKDLIADFRPIIYMENDRDDRSPLLIQQMWDLDYTLYHHIPYYFNRFNCFGNQTNVYGGTISVNMLCIPNEKTVTIPTDCHLIKDKSATWRNYA